MSASEAALRNYRRRTRYLGVPLYEFEPLALTFLKKEIQKPSVRDGLLSVRYMRRAREHVLAFESGFE